jgi:hypothetical protein
MLVTPYGDAGGPHVATRPLAAIIAAVNDSGTKLKIKFTSINSSLK